VTIRRTPEDFRVEERTTAAFQSSLAAARTPSTPFAAYLLEKKSFATPDALRTVAEALKIAPDAVAAAGLKDRHAHTTQTITIDTAHLRREAPERLQGGGESHAWRMKRIGFTQRAADASIIERNLFTIVVRGLGKRAYDEMANRAGVFTSRDGGVDFVNYYGDQRFGSARHGEGFVGRSLVRGDFEQALRLAIGTPARKDSGATRALTRALATHWGDWNEAVAHIPRCPERKAVETLALGGSFRDAFAALPRFTQDICVEAYQSHLWNSIVRELAHAIGETTAQRAYEVEDPFGVLVFPRAAALTPAFRALSVPTPSPKSVFPECLAEIVAGVLGDEGVSLEELRIPGLSRPWFGGGERRFVATAEEWSLSEPRHDEFAGASPNSIACTVRFSLPRGSYATVLLRALGQ